MEYVLFYLFFGTVYTIAAASKKNDTTNPTWVIFTAVLLVILVWPWAVIHDIKEGI